MDYNLRIVGGTIIDGSGGEGYRGDVGIKNGSIVALGKAEGSAARTVDAGGLAVSPGFVDIHTHYDAQVMWDNVLSISPWHGVTTAVMGNCGFGVAPMHPSDRQGIMRTLEKVEGMSYEALEAGLGLDWPFESYPEYLGAIKSSGMAINLASFIGHTPVRLYVMGDDAMEREATADEIDKMAKIVRAGMDAGAVGFSTSMAATHNAFDGRPVPSRLASFAETDALISAMASSGRGIMQCTIGKKLFHDELSDLAKRHEVPVTWTALLSGMTGPGSHRNFKALTAANQKNLLANWTARAVISTLPSDPSENERPLTDVATERGIDATDLALDLSIENNFAARFRFPFINYDQDEVRELLTDENTVVALSDAGAHASQLCDACYSTHFLGHWCREEGIVPIEKAVHMLTQRPADVMGFHNRGRLVEGLPADVVAFDPKTVGAAGLSRVYDQPAGQDRLVSQAIGIHAVIVNGTVIREDGADMIKAGDALPGRLVQGR